MSDSPVEKKSKVSIYVQWAKRQKIENKYQYLLRRLAEEHDHSEKLYGEGVVADIPLSQICHNYNTNENGANIKTVRRRLQWLQENKLIKIIKSPLQSKADAYVLNLDVIIVNGKNFSYIKKSKNKQRKVRDSYKNYIEEQVQEAKKHLDVTTVAKVEEEKMALKVAPRYKKPSTKARYDDNNEVIPKAESLDIAYKEVKGKSSEYYKDTTDAISGTYSEQTLRAYYGSTKVNHNSTQLAKLWADANNTFFDGCAKNLMGDESKKLISALRKVESKYIFMMLIDIFKDWGTYVDYCNKHLGAGKGHTYPVPWFIIKYIKGIYEYHNASDKSSLYSVSEEDEEEFYSTHSIKIASL